MSENFLVKRNDKVGRYGVAANDLQAGEEVLSEQPLTVGPKSCSPPVCLGCYKTVDCSVLCPECKWPVCKEECAKAEIHRGECQVWKESGARFTCRCPGPCPQYECVTPLRLLLATEGPLTGGGLRGQLREMESHCALRRTKPVWASEEVNVVQYLRMACGLQDRFSSELIHRVCGILEVNSFEVITEEGYALRGVYPKMAVLSHSCVANTVHSVFPSQGYRMMLRTSVEVKSGEELFSSYVGCLEPTLVRREVLLESKHFACACPRCADPSELATHMSSLLCSKCDGGLVQSSNPLDENAAWKCDGCNSDMPAESVKKLYAEIKDCITVVDNMPFGPEKLESAEKLLDKYDDHLHPNHGLRTGLWHTLIQLYGRVGGYTIDTLSDVLLQRKLDICNDLLSLLDVIEPGYTRIRGLTLYETHLVQLLLARTKYECGQTTCGQFKEAAKEVASTLREAVGILALEPPTCMEGALARQARMSLMQLTESMNSLPDDE